MENTQTIGTAFDLKMVPTYLEKLTEETKPKWGKMSPQHVLEHMGNTLVIASSNKELPVVTPADKIPAYLEFLKTDKPFTHNIPNPFVGTEPPALRFPDLATAKTKLLAALENFHKFFRENPEATSVHPFFGPLNYEQWQLFQRKHFRHHFEQFGLLD